MAAIRRSGGKKQKKLSVQKPGQLGVRCAIEHRSEKTGRPVAAIEIHNPLIEGSRRAGAEEGIQWVLRGIAPHIFPADELAWPAGCLVGRVGPPRFRVNLVMASCRGMVSRWRTALPPPSRCCRRHSCRRRRAAAAATRRAFVSSCRAESRLPWRAAVPMACSELLWRAAMAWRALSPGCRVAGCCRVRLPGCRVPGAAGCCQYAAGGFREGCQAVRMCCRFQVLPGAAGCCRVLSGAAGCCRVAGLPGQAVRLLPGLGVLAVGLLTTRLIIREKSVRLVTLI